MFKITIEAATVDELESIVAKLKGSTPATTAPKAAAKAETPKSDPTPPTPAASPETPAPPKDEGEGNSQGLTAEAFSKLGMAFAKECGDQGAKAKAIWAKYVKADGTPVTRFGEVQAKDYDAMIAEWEEAKLA